MSTPVLINDRAVECVREAARETSTREGLEALLLVLDKMCGNLGLITSDPGVTSLRDQIHRKIAGLA
jgi:hypothetical protein